MIASDLVVLRSPGLAPPPRLLEAGVLCDLAIVVPGLYVACYWRRGKAAWLRGIALASLGFWSASRLLPESSQVLVHTLWPVRYVALAALLVVELKVMLVIYRSAFSGASRRDVAAALESQAGMPAWAARIAAAEAAFWRAVASKARALVRHGGDSDA